MTDVSSKGQVNPGSQLSFPREPQVSTAATPAALALHNNFKASVDALKRDLVRTIHYLTVIGDKNIHRMLGYRSIYEYAEGVAGFSESQTRAFLRIGRRLQDLPELKKALASGTLSWTKAESISKRATSEDEIEWIDLAQSMSTLELGHHVKKPKPSPSSHLVSSPSQNKPGPKPAPGKPASNQSMVRAPKPAPEKCHVTFVFTAEEYSRWEAMLGKGGGKSKEELLLEGMALLKGGSGFQDCTSPEHLIVIHECSTCGQAALVNSRGNFQVEKPLLERARCDATIQREDSSRRTIIPPRLRRKVLVRDNHRCQYPGCRHARFLQIHHRVPISQGGRTKLENLVMLCSKCHRRLHAEEAEMQRKGMDPV